MQVPSERSAGSVSSTQPTSGGAALGLVLPLAPAHQEENRHDRDQEQGGDDGDDDDVGRGLGAADPC